MAVYFSDHWGAAAGSTPGTGITAIPDPRAQIASAGIKHARKRVNRCFVDLSAVDVADAEVIRLCTMWSADRIYAVKMASSGAGDAGTTVTLGVYATGDNNDGAVLDADLFVGATDVGTAAVAMTDYTDDGALGPEDIGAKLYEQLTVGAQSYTEDPKIAMDICAVLGSTGALGPKLVVEVEYTKGA